MPSADRRADDERPAAPALVLASLPAGVREAFAAVDAVIFDVDGVLTDGRIHVMTDGAEGISFHVRDSSGLWFLYHAGIRTGIVTGRNTGIPEHRAATLRVDAVRSGTRTKAEAVREMLAEWGVPLERCAYVGDDLLDGPALRIVGMPICVADASADMFQLARYVTRRRGGHGAAREVADLVLEARGVRAAMIEPYVGGRCEGGARP